MVLIGVGFSVACVKNRESVLVDANLDVDSNNESEISNGFKPVKLK